MLDNWSYSNSSKSLKLVAISGSWLSCLRVNSCQFKTSSAVRHTAVKTHGTRIVFFAECHFICLLKIVTGQQWPVECLSLDHLNNLRPPYFRVLPYLKGQREGAEGLMSLHGSVLWLVATWHCKQHAVAFYLLAFSGLCHRIVYLLNQFDPEDIFILCSTFVVWHDCRFNLKWTQPRDCRCVNRVISTLFTLSLSDIVADGEMIHPKSRDKESELRDVLCDS